MTSLSYFCVTKVILPESSSSCGLFFVQSYAQKHILASVFCFHHYIWSSLASGIWSKLVQKHIVVAFEYITYVHVYTYLLL